MCVPLFIGTMSYFYEETIRLISIWKLCYRRFWPYYYDQQKHHIAYSPRDNLALHVQIYQGKSLSNRRDEATFCLNGHVNTWNIRMYSARRNPPRHFTYNRPDARQSLNVWVGLTGDNHIIGPFFIQGNINGAIYLNLINNEIVPELQRRYGLQRRGAVPRMWWCQDGAPAHRARAVMARLRELFPGRLVALNEQREWPPRFPDLTPLDVFLWGYLINRVFETVPANLDVLEARIRREIVSLRRTRLVRKSVAEMRVSAQKCILLNGLQVEGRAGLI